MPPDPVAISVFMCGLQLFDPQHVHEHCHQVHGLPNGIASLIPLQTISIDKDTAFSCPDLKFIEDVGPEEKRLAIDAIYNMSIAKGIFVTFNNSRSSLDLSRTRSQEFLREVKKVCLTNFYGRFYMKLGRNLRASGLNISGDFTVKWQTVESCLYEAVSDVEGVTRLDNFLNPVSYTHLTLPTICSV